MGKIIYLTFFNKKSREASVGIKIIEIWEDDLYNDNYKNIINSSIKEKLK